MTTIINKWILILNDRYIHVLKDSLDCLQIKYYFYIMICPPTDQNRVKTWPNDKTPIVG